MTAPSASRTEKSFLASLLNRARRALNRWREVSRLDRDELDAVARDLNISSGDLVTLMYASPDSLEQLDKRLADAGLSEEVLAVSHPDELRDLRRVCSRCSTKARCARDIRHKRMAAPSKYCPNELTLRMLAREARNEEVAQVANVPTQHA